jgi:periplasmic protein TonB
MEPMAILKADPLDLLFENRNKLYGAYALRKFYTQRLFLSMGVMFTGVALMSFIYLYFPSSPVYVRTYIIPDTKIGTAVFPAKEKVIAPPSRPSSPRPPASYQHVTPLIVADQKAPEPPATTDELEKAVIGLKTTTGEAGPGDLFKNGDPAAGAAAQKDSAEGKPEILEFAEVMPEFPGGLEGLKRFLLKNLRMPENNLEAGTQVKVLARFVVGADGKVRNIEITQPAPDIFTVEVKRVILKMPDWKPGLQNHRHVAVYFTLPVNFMAAE